MPAPYLYLCLAPFLAQGALLLVDELCFHRRRGLSRWEANGHPLDTLTFTVALAYLCLAETSPLTLGVYIALATFSCLFVTKDEFVHQAACPAFEHWLHAVLFLLHPTAFVGAGFLWYARAPAALLHSLPILAAGFGLYQFFYWRNRARPAS